jgi:hypothetical protein
MPQDEQGFPVRFRTTLVEPFHLRKVESARPSREKESKKIREKLADQRLEALVVIHVRLN